MKVIIIGGGPAGMLAAISSAKQGNDVTILEKMNSLGKKLCITGKGRCNITSSLPINEFIKNIPGNGKFLYSAINNFTNEDIIQLLEKQGLKTKQERGNRVFPVTDKASDVLDAFIKEMKQYKVKILTNMKVSKVLVENGKVVGVLVNNNKYKADKVILATGGKSYPLTGSEGDGYIMAKELGHSITDIKPSLVALLTSKKDLEVCKKLQGLTLKNVAIKIINDEKEVYNDFGEMLFTHFGVSGPIILSGSAHLVRKNIKNAKVIIDIKPALYEDMLNERILKDFQKQKNKEFKNSLDMLLPKKIIPVILEKMNIDKKVNEVTKEERIKLVKMLKKFEIGIEGFRPVEEAIITAGGISIKEINPKTMESKLVKGLYFAGEIIDVDAYTGGFNLQIAYSTGYTAGLN